jgi:predicted DCC family thiol-disulfide oxidoreductase YuxK
VLTIYIDSWCPLCLRFGSLLKNLDVFGNIQQKDIRNYDGTLISKEKGLQQLASLSPQSIVYYGFDNVWQIVLRLPLLWLFVPLFFLLKISRLGHWGYNELAVKRQIIPLHCKEEECSPK